MCGKSFFFRQKSVWFHTFARNLVWERGLWGKTNVIPTQLFFSQSSKPWNVEGMSHSELFFFVVFTFIWEIIDLVGVGWLHRRNTITIIAQLRAALISPPVEVKWKTRNVAWKTKKCMQKMSLINQDACHIRDRQKLLCFTQFFTSKKKSFSHFYIFFSNVYLRRL